MRRPLWGWYFYDWASQPFFTLIMAFIFAPYFTDYIGDDDLAQVIWGAATGVAGLCIALSAPVVGALASRPGQTMRWMAMLSVIYIIGHMMLWLALPGTENLTLVLLGFVLAFAAAELSTVVSNSLMPSFGHQDEMGQVSSFGWGFGYLGGLVALAVFLLFFAENDTTGKTLIGLDPAFGLDPSAREGTRAVGPYNALWFAVFMIPFFLWVRPADDANARLLSLGETFRDLGASIKRLPRQRSLLAYLGASMIYRDALNGVYFFCGIYAAGVLDWTVTQTGVFGILGLISGIAACWVFGRFDDRLGPKPVITTCVILLTTVTIVVIGIGERHVFGIEVSTTSNLPDIAFYIAGVIIGGAGGTLQTSSRVMMLRQAEPGRVAEGFGLYAMAGRATAFLAPMLISITTALSDSQRIGMVPLFGLFLIGLWLLRYVDPNGHPNHGDNRETN